MAKLLPLLLAILSIGLPLSAQETSLTSEVQVDVMGEDAATARTKAFSKAEEDGLAQLLEKLAPDQKIPILKSLEPKHITALVRGTEVLEEKIAGSRYRATLRVSYSADGINKLIDNRITASSADPGIPGTTATLILPLLKEGEALLLWEENNMWRKYWSEQAVQATAGAIVVPYGDGLDIGAMSAANAMGANYNAFMPLIRRYGVRDVVLLEARPKEDGSVEVVKRRINRLQNEVNLLTYRPDPQEKKNDVLKRASQDIAEQLVKNRAAEDTHTAVTGSVQGKQMVVITFSTMQSWMRLRTALTKVPLVQKLEILALAPQQADILLHYQGTLPALQQALAANGIQIKDAGSYWVITKD